MSRTTKDIPYRLAYVPNTNWVLTENYSRRALPSISPKKRKSLDSKSHWEKRTPSWWNRLYHTKPLRSKFRNFTTYAAKLPVVDLDSLLEPTEFTSKYWW